MGHPGVDGAFQKHPAQAQAQAVTDESLKEVRTRKFWRAKKCQKGEKVSAALKGDSGE